MARVFKRGKNHGIDYNDANGRRHRKLIGPSKRIAEEVLHDVLGKIARRQHLGVIEDSKISFAEFADVWWKRIAHTLKPRTQERWSGIVAKHLKPAFPGSLRAVNQSDAERYIGRRIEQKAAPATVNREMTVLKHIIHRAVGWEYLSRNPFRDAQGETVQGLRPLREPSGRTRFLSLDEIESLLAACDRVPYLKAFALVAMNTGMRRNEVLSLTRRSIDWQNRIAKLPDTKNGDVGQVMLNEVAYKALKSLPARIDSDRLFPWKPNAVSIALGRAIRRAGLVDFRLHDLRHTFGSYQTMRGTAPRALQDLLRHKDGRMTARYSHLSNVYLRTAVDSLALGAVPEASAGRPNAMVTAEK
jgi:integrase